MPIQLRDIEMAGRLPAIAATMPVFIVRGASVEERKPTIDHLGDVLKLGELHAVGAEGSQFFAGEAGEIQFYRPSGALWARNALANREYQDERRPWKQLEKVADPDTREGEKLALVKEAEELISSLAKALLTRASLLAREATFAGVSLEQFARLDAKGKEVERLAGEATARFIYSLDGIRVEGPGAKTYVFFNPGDNGPRATGLFHCWRSVRAAKDVRPAGVEAALESALTRDRELAQYAERKYRIRVTDIRVAYHALGATEHQEYVFPVLRVDIALMAPARSPQGLELKRIYHAVPPASYAHADLYATYLNCSRL